MKHKLWWEEEELSEEQMVAAIDRFRADKPRIVVSHTCPTTVRDWEFRRSQRCAKELALFVHHQALPINDMPGPQLALKGYEAEKFYCALADSDHSRPRRARKCHAAQ